MNKQVHFNVDHAIRQGNLVFGHGWLFHETSETRQLQFKHGSFSIALDFGNPRTDVGKAFRQLERAEQSGFLFYVKLPSFRNTTPSYLEAEFANGERLQIPLTFPDVASKKGALIMTVLRRLWGLIKQRDFVAIREKANRYLKSWAFVSVDSKQLLNSVNDKPCVLFVDHSLGGGTNHYRERRIGDYNNDNKEVLVVTFHPALLGYRIEHHAPQGAVQHYQIDGMESLLALAAEIHIVEIFYNNAVSFPHAESVPSILVALAKSSSARLALALHDYFPFCPSPHLIDSQGHYCGLPEDLAICQTCLKANTQSFVPIYGIKQIDAWREQWRELLAAAQSIQVFSQGMATLLVQTYPDLDPEHIVYSPHSMAYFDRVEPLTPPAAPIRVGVVGNITPIKGSEVVVNFAQSIQQSGRNDIDLIVVGTLQAPSTIPIRQTGSYQHQDLPQILSDEQVNVILFPSIAPETFSYVVQEMKLLDLPIVAFDLGAQAEYLRGYPKGLIVPLATGSNELLAHIIDFHHQIYSNRA
ncbi:MAG: hypothetical protein Kow0065_03600 [Methylomicrobium sp.]